MSTKQRPSLVFYQLRRYVLKYCDNVKDVIDSGIMRLADVLGGDAEHPTT